MLRPRDIQTFTFSNSEIHIMLKFATAESLYFVKLSLNPENT
jgi:hypothetical protein